MARRYPVVRNAGRNANIAAGDALLLRGALDEAAPATIASAGSIDIGAAASNTISITGVTTITALGTVSAGVTRRLVFAGALILTHNATSLILPTAANITTAADDTAEFVSLGSGNWRCASYQRKSGYALLDATGGGGSATQAVAISAGVLDISGSTAETITVDLGQNVTSVVLPAGSAGNVVSRSIVFTQSGAANFTVTGWTSVSIEGGTAPVAGVGSGVVTEYMLVNTNNAGWRMYVDQGVPLSHVGSNGGAHAVADPATAGFLSAADKTKLNAIYAPLSAVMTSTQADTTAVYVNVTQLVLAMEANATYMVECFVTFQSAATATGAGIGFVANGSSYAGLEVVVPIVSTAVASALRTTFPNAAATVTGNVLGTGVTAINSNHTARISGIVRMSGTPGNFQIQFRSEVAASALTLQIGSTLMAWRVA
jgi:hypothetical protein